MFKRYLNRSIAAAVCAAALLLTALPAGANQPPEGYDSWDDYFNSLIYGEQTEIEVPPVEEMQTVSENESFTLYYHDRGADFYLRDRRNGKLWGSAIHPDETDVSDMMQEETSKLLSVSYADETNAISVVDILQAEGDSYSVSAQTGGDTLSLTVSLTEAQISLTLDITLTEDGIEAVIPQDSIAESGTFRLISVSLLPLFGAAGIGEDGYILYPDGSGAITTIKDYELPSDESYTLPLYGLNTQSFAEYDIRQQQDIKSLMLPVTGIKHTDGAVLAAMETGAADGQLTMKLGKLYASYFEMNYRIYTTAEYEFSSSEGTVETLLDKRSSEDFAVKYFILDAPENTYSDMAAVYRGHLEEKGILHRRESDGLPLSVEFFMSIEKNGLFTKQLQVLTDFQDAADIVNDLYGEGVPRLDVLLQGWSKGGYAVLPTAGKAESRLGGSRGLSALYDAVSRDGGRLYLAADLINANSETGQFNAKKDALKNSLNVLVTDADGVRQWLLPTRYFAGAYQRLADELPSGAGVCLTGAGSWLIPDYSGETVMRTELAAFFSSFLSEHSQRTAVSGGNAYVLSAAERLYDIPDNDSQYYQTDYAVPFYQMVVHGYIDYTSLAGNLSFDYSYQKLRWMETGSIPHFVLTQNSPVLLRDTDYDRLFSSEYSLWKDKVLAVYREMSETLSGVWDQTMTRHEYLTDTLVRVTYEDGSRLYLNYGGEEADWQEVTVPSMDYVFVKGVS